VIVIGITIRRSTLISHSGTYVVKTLVFKILSIIAKSKNLSLSLLIIIFD